MGRFSAEEVASAIADVEGKLQLTFYEEQRIAITKFVAEHDLFVALPTSFGKSLVFQSMPLIYDFLRHQTIGHSIALVISPLISLTEDQICRSEKLGLKAVNLSSIAENSAAWQSVINGDFSLVYSSPETILSDKGTKLISSSYYSKHLCGIFIDEAHCIAKWGHSSDHTKVFRKDYGRLAELRSMVPSSVHICVLTATATEEVKDLICANLALSSIVFIEQSPNRKNIRYTSIKTKSSNPADSVDWLVAELSKKGKHAERIIVFCQTRDQCDQLYGKFESALGDRKTSPFDRHYAMFHAWTPQQNKDNVINSFAKEDGIVRVLFATVAFGMGIDTKGVNTIIHFGSPKTILDYVQETGRAGRDGSESLALLMDYPRANARRKPEKSMKEYAQNNSECRRKCLMKNFKDVSAEAEYTCCSVCQPSTNFWVENACLALGNTGEQTEHISRQVLPEDVTNVRSALGEFQEELLLLLPTGSSGIRALTGDIPTGITQQLIGRLTNSCEEVLSFDEFQTKHPFFNTEQAQRVYEIMEDKLKDCCVIHTMNTPSTVAEEESDDSGTSESGGETEYASVEFVSDEETEVLSDSESDSD